MGNKGKNGNFTNAGKGRPKGVKNKFTHFKDALYEVFERKGGVDGLEKWASDKKNEKVFYEFMAKMLPREVNLSAEVDHKGVVILPEKNKE